jgi:hypothetical protein
VLVGFRSLVLAAALALIGAASGCASGGDGGGGRRDTGPVPLDTGGIDGAPTDAHVDPADTGEVPDASMDDVGPVDGGPPPTGDSRSSSAVVPGGHVASSPHYRLVGATLSFGASAPPSSGRYVLRENVIGRIGDPSP